MYICVCNGLNDEKIKKTVRNGAETPREVFSSHGCKAQCGRCINSIQKIVKEEKPSLSPLMAAE